MSGDRLAQIETYWKGDAPVYMHAHPKIIDDVLALVEIAKAARVVADMHESGEGFRWIGSEDDTEALDAICAALARLDSGAAEGDA